MIPLAKDTREAIGSFANKVENRSLLFQKMVLSKSWGHDARFDDANRYNVLRACSSGSILLVEDQKDAQQKANSLRARDDVKQKAGYRAKVAGALAGVKVDNAELAKRQIENANDLLSLIERSYRGRSHTFVGSLGGRLLINMAGGVQENADMSLDRCFGLPHIPGSAVKGVTRHTALWDIRNTADAAERRRKLRLALLAFGFIVEDLRAGRGKPGDFVWAAGNESLVHEARKPFAEQDSFKGLLSFLPAYPTEKPEIVAEVLTPHPRADGSRGREPHPIFFPAVEAGSCFGFAIVTAWSPGGLDASPVLAQAGAWLRSALTAQGIGAKTGAGYGWFTIDPRAQARREAAMQETARQAEARRLAEGVAALAREAEARRLAALPAHESRASQLDLQLTESSFADFAKALSEKPEADRHAFCFLLAAKHRERWKKWRKSDKWKERLPQIQKIAAGFGIQLP